MKIVEDLFIVDVFKDAKVVAGQNGLQRIVESIEISETPDVINYLAENSLLLTTGFAFKDNPNGLCTLVKQLSSYPCAGIAIKLKRYIDALPREVIDYADELEFPIIQIPSSLTLGNVASQLSSFLWNNKTEELFYAIQIQKKFNEMMLKGYNLPSLIENLGYSLHCPVLLLNPLGEITANTQHFKKENMKHLKKNVEGIFKSDIEKYRNQTKIYLNNLDSPQSAMSVNIFQVKTMHPYPYLLLIFNAEQLKYPSSQLAIEQASTVISFTLLKNEAINESSRLLENNFFGSLVDGKIATKQEIVLRGKPYGLLENNNYLCIVFKTDEDTQDRFQQSDVMMNQNFDYLYELFTKSTCNTCMDSILFMKNEFFVLIIQVSGELDHRTKNTIQEKLENFQQDAFTTLNMSLSFGIGNFVNDVANIPITYAEAAEAWKLGSELYHHHFLHFYETKKLKELIRFIPEDNLKEFYENILRSLAYPKSRDEEDLIHTLIVYLENNCQIAVTSKKLFVHRNTVKYRIAKCEEILSYSVHEPQNSLHLRVALLMRSTFTKTNGD